MAIHAVEGSLLAVLSGPDEKGVGEGPSPPRVHHLASVLHPRHPIDHPTRGIQRHVRHPVVGVDVPVNAGRVIAVRRVAPADPHEHLHLPVGVLLVAQEVVLVEPDLGEELRGPVTLLAHVLSGSKVVDRRGNGGGVALHDRLDHLTGPRPLALHVPIGAGADVTGHARHASMGRCLVRPALGLHDRVTHLAAELGGLGVVIALVQPDGGEEEPNARAGEEHDERVSMRAFAQIHDDGRAPHPPAAPLPHHPHRNEE